ncbi:hypothetical protein C2G38_2246149 [Gigaspora rosea]|uniref:Uncharacterized protein n=1 Tax=Gigaspora rosea TaxID=44941 RepID=A0A397V5U3_9GLOM|nr:hypothetical protein C2G38_2246149 [Gigaspora rosea]
MKALLLKVKERRCTWPYVETCARQDPSNNEELDLDHSEKTIPRVKTKIYQVTSSSRTDKAKTQELDN